MDSEITIQTYTRTLYANKAAAPRKVTKLNVRNKPGRYGQVNPNI